MRLFIDSLMSFSITLCGGALLIIMGQNTGSESLFYYFRIDHVPEYHLLRILLIGHLYGITSERRLVEDIGMHLAYHWFTGQGSDQEGPHHSTFSKNRHGRFQESPLFVDRFERVIQQCMQVGLLKGADLSVDDTQIRADASPDRAITRDQLVDVAKVNRTVREYVEQIERETSSQSRRRRLK